MIQPLRTVHRRAFVALAFVLPVLLALGLGARRARTSPATQPITEINSAKQSGVQWQKHAIRSRLYAGLDTANRPQDIFVTLEPAQNVNEPDLLLYWAGSEPQGGSLPTQARLLGALSASNTFTLPREVNGAGYLVLYSLAHQTVVDTARVENLP